ncbi:hypothetical protein CCACVL1_11798 [Corchorus capsularis]|uniref:Uncharacterized protein n=1 Tax=Corchorus capsularis TaxID=210143 RepID=A0A1R3IJE5_COCAP|nr:hypothetical protein CCACVL1_11798 [Corchorus capsularis]
MANPEIPNPANQTANQDEKPLEAPESASWFSVLYIFCGRSGATESPNS